MSGAAAGVLALVDPYPTAVVIALTVAVAPLVGQLVVVRPPLGRRTDAVLAGRVVERSRVHLAYVALELVKVVALLAAGIALLAV